MLTTLPRPPREIQPLWASLSQEWALSGAIPTHGACRGAGSPAPSAALASGPQGWSLNRQGTELSSGHHFSTQEPPSPSKALLPPGRSASTLQSHSGVSSLSVPLTKTPPTPPCKGLHPWLHLLTLPRPRLPCGWPGTRSSPWRRLFPAGSSRLAYAVLIFRVTPELLGLLQPTALPSSRAAAVGRAP